MQNWGITKAQSKLIQAPFNTLSVSFDLDPQVGQDIGRARRAGDFAVPMLGRRNAAGCRDDGCSCRNVKGSAPVTPGSTSVELVWVFAADWGHHQPQPFSSP